MKTVFLLRFSKILSDMKDECIDKKQCFVLDRREAKNGIRTVFLHQKRFEQQSRVWNDFSKVVSNSTPLRTKKVNPKSFCPTFRVHFKSQVLYHKINDLLILLFQNLQFYIVLNILDNHDHAFQYL